MKNLCKMSLACLVALVTVGFMAQVTPAQALISSTTVTEEPVLTYMGTICEPTLVEETVAFEYEPMADNKEPPNKGTCKPNTTRACTITCDNNGGATSNGEICYWIYSATQKKWIEVCSGPMPKPEPGQKMTCENAAKQHCKLNSECATVGWNGKTGNGGIIDCSKL